MNFGGCVKDALKNKATLSLSFLTMAAQNGTAGFEKKSKWETLYVKCSMSEYVRGVRGS